MKKFVTFALIILSTYFSGVVSGATSMWGMFEGNPIVKIKAFGEELIASDVPAINYNNRTMVPIYMLRQLGLEVQWDAATETVNISLPSSTQTTTQAPPQTTTQAPPVYTSYPELWSNDGETFLGYLTTNTYETDGIFNEYGTYGNPYALNSIWNEYGLYGSDYSLTSAFNKYTLTPPIIFYEGEIIGYVTVNENLENYIRPDELYDFLLELGF